MPEILVQERDISGQGHKSLRLKVVVILGQAFLRNLTSWNEGIIRIQSWGLGIRCREGGSH